MTGPPVRLGGLSNALFVLGVLTGFLSWHDWSTQAVAVFIVTVDGLWLSYQDWFAKGK